MEIGWLSELQEDGTEREPPWFSALLDWDLYTFGPSPGCSQWMKSPTGTWQVGDTYCTIKLDQGKVYT